MTDSSENSSEKIVLTDMQIRVLGSLVEKSTTTPDQYPLTLNSTKVACNQKSSREPVVNYDDNQVRNTLYDLEKMGFARQLNPSDSRVAKYEHRFGKRLDITLKEQAILCVLMMRGSQTVNEIRTRAQRQYEFSDNLEVERILKRMIDRLPYPLVVNIPKQAGQKESRYAHLLDGKEMEELVEQAASRRESAVIDSGVSDDIAALKNEIERLKERIERLEEKG